MKPRRNDDMNDVDKMFQDFTEREERRRRLCSSLDYDAFCREDMRVLIERGDYLRNVVCEANHERNVQFAARRLLGDL
jgi:hypothetical protein